MQFIYSFNIRDFGLRAYQKLDVHHDDFKFKTEPLGKKGFLKQLFCEPFLK